VAFLKVQFLCVCIPITEESLHTVGDYAGNLHLNMTSAEYDQAIMDRIEPYVYDWTAKQRGSISAEHGLGTSGGHCVRSFVYYHSRSV